MVAGVLLGHFAPALPELLARFEYARISIPMAVLIWVMIYPMMLKVDFQSIRNVGKSPKGLFVTWIVNWLIKPFTMYGIASLFFFVLFKGFITPELATEYLAVAIALFSTTSPAALAATVGVLTEVPVMLFLVKIANRTRGCFQNGGNDKK